MIHERIVVLFTNEQKIYVYLQRKNNPPYRSISNSYPSLVYGLKYENVILRVVC